MGIRKDRINYGERAREVLSQFDRERQEARELQRRHDEATRGYHDRDQYLRIERRRFPR